MSNRSTTALTEATLSKLAESINQYAASAVTSLVVPEFRGSPGEDVKDFISRFKTATITLSDEMKCLAMAKALTNSAKIWAKENLKAEMNSGNWKSVKKLLKQRFAGLDSDMKNLERLNKLSHEPEAETLISYLEKYAVFYRSAHKEAKDADIIRALKLNLPRNVVRGLNMLNDEWVNFQEMKELYTLARRVEDKILAYESQEPHISSAKAEDITKMLREVKEILKTNQAVKDDLQKSKETLAAIKSSNNPPVNHQTPYYARPHNEGYYNQRGNNPGPHNKAQNPYNGYYKDNYNRRQNYQPQSSGTYGFKQVGPPPKRRAIEAGPKQNAISTDSHQKPENKQTDVSIVELYYKTYGKPPGDCHHCKGPHFNRHCPYKDLN